MIEANENISLVTERQMHDVEQGQAQARAIAEGREVHPAVLAAQAEASFAAPQQASSTALPAAQSIQRPAVPPPDPEKSMRHMRLSIAIVIALVVFLLWCRQRSNGRKQ